LGSFNYAALGLIHEQSKSVERRGLCGLVGTADRAGRRVLVPVAGGDVVVGADVVPTEAKVVGTERPVGVVEVSVVGDNVVVVAGLHKDYLVSFRLLENAERLNEHGGRSCARDRG
jgi:hypothetical protein